ncbi:MAG: protocatechuate 3,4-dioxygenase, alpha subunit [Streptosporangiaceae bacterium]|jgi:protocatechuate 3,4-dioxygenase alpha subunit|nr:protocatechuate 3,4-dioxygenase subunit alpha [Streptosporangiaceae bacterium]MDX6431153.1 protocatechuate 3,4-dioxygenase, alpha subunit [Streptosporangiaceae bacterium]
MITPSQTVGPFFGYALPYAEGQHVVPPWQADAVLLYGRVVDGAGDPVPDAIVEIAQAGADGRPPAEVGALRRAGNGFSGFGRSATDGEGGYWFTTVKPGGTNPYIAMLVFARGLLKPVATRVYFPEDAVVDPLLRTLEPERRSTLIAVRDERGYRFDIHLQGARETVFLAF